MTISLYALIDNGLRILYTGSYVDVSSYKEMFYSGDESLKVIHLKGEY